MPAFQIIAETYRAPYIAILIPPEGLEVQHYLQYQTALRRCLGRRLE